MSKKSQYQIFFLGMVYTLLLAPIFHFFGEFETQEIPLWKSQTQSLISNFSFGVGSFEFYKLYNEELWIKYMLHQTDLNIYS